VLRAPKLSWLRVAVHVGALLPLATLLWAAQQHRLGPDPVGEAILRTGRYALALLLLSLLPTAIRLASGWARALRVRRALGLYAFLYGVLHLAIYAGLDYRLDAGLLLQAVREGRSVQVGLAALLILVPLAATSTRGWVRRLGPNWRRLHRLVYLAAALAVLHYAWKFKELRREPLVAAASLALLLLLRLPPVAGLLRGRRPAKAQR
jgi:sulfoxide reductase heme-binding subunit YedZ